MVKVELRDVQEIGDPEKGDPRNLALVVKDVAAEEILRGLERHKVLIDAGSACGAGALSPSHVLEAMGYGSTGHLRITLRPFHTISDLKLLVRSLKSEIEGFRAI